MIWQDILIGIGTIILSYALVPQVIYGFKKKKKTVVLQASLATVIGLSMLTISYTSLKMTFALITNLLATFLWVLLLIQGILYKEIK